MSNAEDTPNVSDVADASNPSQANPASGSADNPSGSAAPQPPPPPPSEPTPPTGNAPVAPWNAPKPTDKAEVKPVQEELKQALQNVDSPEKAAEVVRKLEETAGTQTAGDVARAHPTPASSAEAAQQVKQAGQAANPGDKPTDVIAETARVVTAAKGREREAVAQAVQGVFNPDQQGQPTTEQAEQREYLQGALLNRLKPLDKLDADLFLKINHLNHTPFLNRFFYFITAVFTGGTAWYGLMLLARLRDKRLGKKLLRESVLPLALATAIVELPIKSYFRRKRPFITIIQAIAVGVKPGSWSFPSGHSASAFAGAFLFGRYFPRFKGVFYAIAGLVAFSRVYLGDHYPGDVTAGSVAGVFFAWLFHQRRWPWQSKKKKRAAQRRSQRRKQP